MNPDLELTILMPCLNEAETLVRCIEKRSAVCANWASRARC